MKLHRIAVLIGIIAMTATGMCGEKENLWLVHALGGTKWTGKNDNSVHCFDYSRGNHRLRLEDVNLSVEYANKKPTRCYGTFTLTNRRRFSHDPHVLVELDIADGNVKHIKLQKDGGGNWYDVLPSKLLKKEDGEKAILDAVKKIGTNGDAQKAIASDIWKLQEDLKSKTKK